MKPPPKSEFIHSFFAGYGDTDQSGVIHHAVFIRWLEDARAAWLRHHKVDFMKMEKEERKGVAVVHLELSYKRPAHFNDLIEVEVWIGRLSTASIRFDYRIWVKDELLVEAQVKLATIDLDEMKATKVPETLSQVCKPPKTLE